MSSRKAKIAEILYDLPTNKLSTEDIRWVMSHLPDTDERGQEATKPVGAIQFDTTAEVLEKMVGMEKKDILELMYKFQDSFENTEAEENKAKILENFYPQLNDKEKVYIIGMGIPRFQTTALKVAIELKDEGIIDTALGSQAADIPFEEKREILAKILAMKESGLGGLLGLLGGLR